MGNLEGRVSRVFMLWGQTEISVLQFLGIALGHGCCFLIAVSPVQASHYPQVRDMGQGAHLSHYCTGSFFICEGEAMGSGSYLYRENHGGYYVNFYYDIRRSHFVKCSTSFTHFWWLVCQVLIMCPNVQSSCLSLLSAQITVLQHHTWDKMIFLWYLLLS